MSGLVIAGASLAGLRAAEAARRAGFGGAITMLGAERHPPYDRPPLSKELLDGSAAPEPTTYRSLLELRDEVGVELLLGTPATGLDPVSRTVHAGERRIPYDSLVIATGARARVLPGAPGLVGVHALRGLDDALAVRRELDRGPRTVVVGGGFIGSEVASSARKRGLPVTIVEAGAAPLAGSVGALMAGACAALHARHGTHLRCGVSVTGFEGSDRVRAVHLSDGSKLDADLVVVGIGATPAVEWLAGSGLAIDDGVVCDQTLASSIPGVYAAGDVARWHNPTFDAVMRLEHWANAAAQGTRAGLNAIDPGSARPFEAVPMFWSDWYGSRLQFVGIAGADNVVVVDGVPDGGRCVALYRGGDRIVGALAIDASAELSAYRRLIARRARWDEALQYAGVGRDGAGTRL